MKPMRSFSDLGEDLFASCLVDIKEIKVNFAVI